MTGTNSTGSQSHFIYFRGFKYVLFFIILLITKFPVLSQEDIQGEIEYTVKFNSFTREQVSKMSASTRALLNNTSPVTATLGFSREETVYSLKEGLINDSEGVNITRVLAGNKDLYYFSRAEKKILRQTSTSGKTFLVEYPVIQWKILEETKKVLNFTCYKAVPVDETGTEKGVVAWFTPEISLEFGPLLYNGLPGLIMQLENSRGSFTVSSIDLDKTVQLPKPSEGEVVTEQEYSEILRKLAPPFFEISE